MRAMRARRAGLLVVLVLAALCAAPLEARAALGSLVHVARAGDTAESLAATYYGNRAHAIFIREANHLGSSGRLQEGQTVRIPGAFRIHVKKGDTLEKLALRFLDDTRRARFLGEWNGLKLSDILPEGAELKVPFHLTHRAEAPEAFKMLAKLFYNDAEQGRLLADYNFRKVMVLTKGERVVIPVPHVFIKPAMLAGGKAQASLASGSAAPQGGARGGEGEADGARVERVGDEATEEPEEAQQEQARAPDAAPPDPRARRALERLRLAEEAWHEGRYEEVVDELTRALGEEEVPEPQRAAMQRLLGFGYVAIGHEAPAMVAFREVLRTDPEATLDAALVSPKIRAVFERARASR